MQLYYFLAVVISLSFGAVPGESPDVERSLMFSAAVVAVWWVMCFLSVRMVTDLIRKGDLNVDTGWDWFERQTVCLRWFSIAIIALCLGGFGWGRCAEDLAIVKRSITLQSLWLLTPMLAIVTALWAAEYRFARFLGVASSGWTEPLKWMVRVARSSLAWITIPILVMLALVDAISFAPLSDLARGWILATTMIGLGVFGMPLLVKRVFPRGEIDPSMEAWMNQILHSAGLSKCKLVMWDTRGRSYNAMMAGFLGRFQVLFVTDRLVRDLSRAQVAMVVLHEVAHARRKHALLRVVALAPAWILGFMMQGGLEYFLPGSDLVAWGPILGNALSLLATVLILRQVSYYCEYDADAAACQLAPSLSWPGSELPDTVEDAGRTLSSALVRVTEGCEGARNPSWLHPGISQRIDAVMA
ncbi:M48 family metalloprotease [Rhodopirellula sp. MGV]|uniref:M48 family metalloprotease n=1 Tax=Rhodopirellula sp. MGV TaxID=2023130 RepID=UPI000B971E35|nr:M48 family metalloprotease [Rhodopirellula sp. MGV]OYP38852.1 hypothetical protein CGZ80_01130 [Rhodopirellula sp. MGV]PNY37661.1 hypothetical protein C2E31_06860 [Rhodopirellula baltica]